MDIHVKAPNDAKRGPTLERIGSHSHIKGLGLKQDTIEPLHRRVEVAGEPGAAPEIGVYADGMVGQEKARKAAGLLVKLMKDNQWYGRGVLLAGAAGTGKTALALGVAQSLGKDVPFTMLSGSEIYSLDKSKSESLTQAIRRSIGVKIHEMVEKIEGEVMEIIVDRPVTGTTVSGKLTIKTTDMETIYDLGPKLVDALAKEKITAGDVIAIDKTNGRITKLGRSYSRARDYDAVSSSIQWVSCPSGELLKRKQVAHVITLHDVDVLNSRTSGIQALFSGDTGEIKPEVRLLVDQKLLEWKEEGKAELLPGVLFIDEAYMLDVEAFTFLHKGVLESSLAPILILASNKGVQPHRIRGSGGERGPYGIPPDFLDRLLVITTTAFSAVELKEILRIRAKEENVVLSELALDSLTQLAENTSLRYASQLIMVSHLISRRLKASAVMPNHVERASLLFLDQSRSLKLCAEKYLQ